MTFFNSITRAAYPLTSRRRVTLADFVALHRQRKALNRLDDAALRDLGLSRSDVQHEAERPFWDVPATWRD
ncbi:DUF1127 domain-containing protein [Salinihabitans flavidus]|uniref:DUF1127 domain-containing protein n=1 Tax=Salinihabitans flavidus TaxID=569882 RepID=UPI001587009C|nr:DUF1127 domain-containing protein [Salinihabitans flavidus]